MTYEQAVSLRQYVRERLTDLGLTVRSVSVVRDGEGFGLRADVAPGGAVQIRVVGDDHATAQEIEQ